MHRMSGLTQLAEKMIMWYFSVYTESLQMSEDTNNPVYKLMTDNLQLVLTCKLNQFLNTKVSQDSVATHLRCDETF